MAVRDENTGMLTGGNIPEFLLMKRFKIKKVLWIAFA